MKVSNEVSSMSLQARITDNAIGQCFC